MRQVPARFQNFELRAWNEIAVRRPFRRRNDLVAVAPDQQRWAVDAMQPFAQVWIVEPWLPYEFCQRQRVLRLPLAVLVVGNLREDAVSECLIHVDVANVLLLGPQEQ